MLQKKRTFRGGYRFRKLAGTPKPAIEELALPSEVIIPLKQGFGGEVPPIVMIGDKVTAGQIIGIDDDTCSSPVHATVNGTVNDLRTIKRFGEEIGAVVIKSDGSRGWPKMALMSDKIGTLDPGDIGRILYMSGVASLGRFGFPTVHNTSRFKAEDVDSLVINAVNSEPFALSSKVLLTGNTENFIKGVDILRRALPRHVEVYVGVDDHDKDIIKVLETTAKWLHIHPLKAKYPQDHEVILVQTILGREVPYGGCAINVQAVVMDAQSALHAYEAVIEGKPVIERVVALGGSGLNESLYVKARMGTTLEHIIRHRMKSNETRCIYGGIMTGTVCDELSIPVDRTVNSIAVLEENRTRQFLSFLRFGTDSDSFSNAFLSSLLPMVTRKVDTNMHGEFRPCIYCNYCEMVCPAGLAPYLLSQYVTHNMLEKANELRILACIDCGLCTYVCPSKLPVMKHIQAGKIKLK